MAQPINSQKCTKIHFNLCPLGTDTPSKLTLRTRLVESIQIKTVPCLQWHLLPTSPSKSMVPQSNMTDFNSISTPSLSIPSMESTLTSKCIRFIILESLTQLTGILPQLLVSCSPLMTITPNWLGPRRKSLITSLKTSIWIQSEIKLPPHQLTGSFTQIFFPSSTLTIDGSTEVPSPLLHAPKTFTGMSWPPSTQLKRSMLPSSRISWQTMCLLSRKTEDTQWLKLVKITMSSTSRMTICKSSDKLRAPKTLLLVVWWPSSASSSFSHAVLSASSVRKQRTSTPEQVATLVQECLNIYIC